MTEKAVSEKVFKYKDKNSGLNFSSSERRYILVAFGLLIISGLFVFYHLYYADKIIARVNIKDVNVGGLSIQQASEKLKNELKTDLSFKVTTPKLEKDFSSQTVDFQYNYDLMVKEAYEIGRSGSLTNKIKDRLLIPFTGTNNEPRYSFNQNKLNLFLSMLRLEGTDRYHEPEYAIEEEKLVIIEGSEGDDFDFEKSKSDLVNKLVNNDSTDYSLQINRKAPTLKVEELESKRSEIELLLDKNFRFVFKDLQWEIPDSELLTFFSIEKGESGMELKVDNLAIASKLNVISHEIDRVPSGQVLKVENGKVLDFKPSLEGRELKVKENAELIANQLFNPDTKDISLIVSTVVAPESDNDYGIKELLAEGTSKFKGSISSRIHNIGVASSKVSGILVPPGEVFSFNKNVGQIDRSTGYKSAYVISGGRTVLGDGGGVCQVSTTVFRAALNAGFEIIERNPHSYRVGYYEQDSGPGLDASIFVPSADFKFRNDTQKHILVVSEFNAENFTLSYKIYGTPDGRKVEVGKPEILSKRSAPPTIYEDDPNLAKGQRRQVESAVGGASVQFTRKVIKDGETILNDVFKSNYRAWPAVIKVGTKE